MGLEKIREVTLECRKTRKTRCRNFLQPTGGSGAHLYGERDLAAGFNAFFSIAKTENAVLFEKQ